MDWQTKQSLKDLYLIAYPIVFGIGAALFGVIFGIVWLVS